EGVAPDEVAFAVADNGIGIEMQYAERIFKPFQRLHGRTTYEGAGIGLSICRRIVDRHQGHIALTSVPGEGTTFTVRLPLTQETAQDSVQHRPKST
ncbi:MAG: hypothetical protein KDD84_02715, partial [Caldilineaceae bacterium]|nr:hypothetical protein [Caldilineaceae bacterium]